MLKFLTENWDSIILGLQIYAALGISYFVTSMFGYWRELLEYHKVEPVASLITDVITIVDTTIRWPWFLYCDFFLSDDEDDPQS